MFAKIPSPFIFPLFKGESRGIYFVPLVTSNFSHLKIGKCPYFSLDTLSRKSYTFV